LQDSEEHYRLITDAAFDGLVILEDGMFVEVNQAFQRMFGYAKSELIGRSPTMIATAESANTIIQHITNRDEGLYQIVGLRKDGRQINVEVIGRNTTRHDRPARVTALRDVTARQQAEDALRKSEELSQLFIAHAPVALAMFDREMCYLAVSRRWTTDYGLDDQQVIGRSHYELFPEIPEQWLVEHRRGMEGEVRRSEVDHFVRADGRVQWIRWEIRPWKKVDGSVGGIVILTEDITDRKLAEDELRESLLRQQLLIKSSNIGLWDWDLVTNEVFLSPEWKSQLGYADDELPDKFD